MLITVKMELSFEDLERECWSGAVDTLNTIKEHDMEDAFMDLLFEVFCDGDYPTLTAINDLLWMDSDWIFETLEISENEEEEEEEFDEWENNPWMDEKYDGQYDEL